jgi:hypothetical protein
MIIPKKYLLKDGSIYWHKLYYALIPKCMTAHCLPGGSYNYAYYLVHPHMYFIELFDNTKWFIQRGWRGYSDCDVWGWYSHNARVMVGVLSTLRKTTHGYPVGMSPAKWDKKLAVMQDGFQAVIDEEEDFRSYKRLGRKEHLKLVRSRYQRTRRGLKYFREYYHNLWD